MKEPTKAQKLAGTLEYLIERGLVPGLLPKDVHAAADLLCEQEAELETLRAALATKDHIVTAKATTDNYRTTIRATFIITDPRIYYGEVQNDSFMLEEAGDDLIRHQSRSLANAATRDWLNDLHERTYVAVRMALAAIAPIEAGTAET